MLLKNLSISFILKREKEKHIGFPFGRVIIFIYSLPASKYINSFKKDTTIENHEKVSLFMFHRFQFRSRCSSAYVRCLSPFN